MTAREIEFRAWAAGRINYEPSLSELYLVTSGALAR